MFTRLFSGVREEAHRCRTADGSLHVTIYEADRASGVPIVIAGPDGEERSFATRTLVTTARALAVAGHQVLRFDYLGQGHSGCEYEASTVASRIGSLRECWSLLRTVADRPPIVLGVRLGATLAAAALPHLPQVKHLVLWAPVLDPGAYVQQLLRVNISMQMVVHGKVLRDRAQLMEDAHSGQLISTNGYRLTGRFIDELLGIDPVGMLTRWDGSGLIVSSTTVAGALASSPSWRVAQVPCPQFWKELKTHQVTPPPFLDETLSWLRRANLARVPV
jgi:pimeloyl-ACP methyl ester carboxylesterase